MKKLSLPTAFWLCAALANGCDDSSSSGGGSDAAAHDAASGGGGDVSPGLDAAISTRATVVGTLTLPGMPTGKPYSVRLMTAPGAAPVAQVTGFTNGFAALPFSIADVPAGTYLVLAFVDVDGSGGSSSTPGDFAGWFGHTGDGNPPPGGPNAVVPATGMVRFDFALVVR